jgi:hypothetical protein
VLYFVLAAVSLSIVIRNATHGSYAAAALFGIFSAVLVLTGLRQLQGRSTVPQTRGGLIGVAIAFFAVGILFVDLALHAIDRGSTVLGVIGLTIAVSLVGVGTTGIIQAIRHPEG